jgi:hypothetical protein
VRIEHVFTSCLENGHVYGVKEAISEEMIKEQQQVGE